MSLFGAAALGVTSLFTASPALAAPPNHDTVVADVPSSQTPNIVDGNVVAIYDAGTKVIAAGSFTQAQNRGSSPTTVTQKYVLAFDKATGDIDTAFKPVLDRPVNAVIAGPTADTVYLAGEFTTANGVNRRKLALVNVSDGSLVTTFKGPAFNGTINDITKVGDRLLVGGIFFTADASARNGLASLDATTGALDSYLNVPLTEHHNWTTGSTGAQAGVGAEKLTVSPDGKQLVVIGNFKKADAAVHDQIVRINLGDTSATVADWNTDRYAPACRAASFDSYVRDVQFSPDGKYFVVGTTGAAYPGTLCDAVARWESDATGSGQQPTWVNYSGGDTFLSVGISEQAVYVGGHFRWSNNSTGTDKAAPGAVGRPSIAALDPKSGLPLAWNPGRHPRGYGVTELLVTDEGLWLGSDEDWIGNFQYKRAKIAFFPLTGGNAPHSTATKDLPGNVYQAGQSKPTQVLYRVNAGGPQLAAIDGGPNWAPDPYTAPSSLHNAGSNTKGYATPATLDSTVPGSTPVDLFSTERWDPNTAPEMQWNFPVPAGAQIQVRLYLANRYSGTGTVGSRVFNVSIDGALKLDRFDAVAATGGTDRGTMRSFPLVSDGNVDIDFGHVVENPLVQGIEIVQVAPAPTADDVLYRVNAGGPAVAAASGPAWAVDTVEAPSQYHNAGSNTKGYATLAALDATVPAGTPASLYSDERWDPSTAPDMQWDFPVPAGQQVQVRLYLANRYTGTNTPGKRFFDVSIDGLVRLNDFDPVVEAGGTDRGTMRAFTVTSDGNVDIDFGRVVENPLVQAIELVKVPALPSAAELNSVTKRSYDGGYAAGSASAVANSDGTAWASAKGAFWIGGTLFYGMNGSLYQRSFDGDTFGAPSKVDPYHDATWDTVETGSAKPGESQTYVGSASSFYAEIPNVTGMFYKGGRLYYTLAGQSSLYWRWFTPDSGTVGADRFTYMTSTFFAGAGGVFTADNSLYVVRQSNGNLERMAWPTDPSEPQFSSTVSGPGMDGVDWRGAAVFVGP
ncbi:malectin domain-containing carbohydrate-binding protein [Micromonospora sp. 4G57]|uniref:Malectin domain-containing carbohydrate-binding protein n=1 Tax=Micromonospora sicca TaxID=2202420 RepID=A0ABU5JJX7_9ACTN|nr:MULTISPECIES: malectin domain-containing carbohydrate-binding protein [unclassified Micromonospora]MDZ5446313.1 malectin domain-containing carbohydrate-binding protein [Micromonospora sp. 4G57]MDZ5492937.1 malectin domain-containing carbohydrate-binding protein [Micromonospora sp. 4G53]